jgi:hypothetical protein
MGTVNSSKKAYISFLMSVFLMSSMAALAYIGIFNFKNFPAMPVFVKAIAFVAAFSTLFLLIFLLFNLKRRSSRKRKAATVEPEGVTRHQNGLLASATAYQGYDLSPSAGIDETSRHDVIYEKNGVPYINGDLAKNSRKNLDGNFVKLVESVTGILPPPVLRQQDKPDKAHKGSQG